MAPGPCCAERCGRRQLPPASRASAYKGAVAGTRQRRVQNRRSHSSLDVLALTLPGEESRAYESSEGDARMLRTCLAAPERGEWRSSTNAFFPYAFKLVLPSPQRMILLDQLLELLHLTLTVALSRRWIFVSRHILHLS